MNLSAALLSLCPIPYLMTKRKADLIFGYPLQGWPTLTLKSLNKMLYR